MKFEEFEIGTNSKKHYTVPEKNSAGKVRLLGDIEYERLYSAKFVRFVSWKTVVENGIDYKTEPDFLSLYLYGYLKGKKGYRRTILDKYSISYPEIPELLKKAEGSKDGKINKMGMDHTMYRSLKSYYKEQYESWKADYEAGKDPHTEMNFIMMYIFEVLNSSEDVRQMQQKINAVNEKYKDSFSGLDAFLKRLNERENRAAEEPVHEERRPYRIRTLEEIEKEFVRDGEKYSKMTSDAAVYAELRGYMPTFANLSREQLEYYIYFRTQTRNRKKVKTSRAYADLYITEIVNGIGVSPEEGYEELLNIYALYREDIPELDMYMPGWILDYTDKNRLERNISVVSRYASGLMPVSYSDLITDRLFREDPVRLNYGLLVLLSDYDPENNKFFNDYTELFKKHVPNCFAAVCAYIKKSGVSVAEKYGVPVRQRDRSLFSRLIYSGNRILGRETVYCYAAGTKMRKFVTEFLRCAENELRKHVGFKTRLRNVDFEPELSKLVAAYFDRAFAKPKPEKEEKISINIDTGKLKDASEDAEATVRMLSTEESGIEKAEFTEKELLLIEKMRENGGKLGESEMYGFDDGYILLVDGVNEKQIINTGRVLISESNGIYRLEEDIPEKAESETDKAPEYEVQNETSLKETSENADDAETAETEDAAGNDAETFTALEKAYIKAALESDTGRMFELADSAGELTEMIEEKINEKTLEIYSDILLEGGEIVADYTDFARKVTEG